jgi:Tfp pilus assembly protein PilE
MKKQHILLVVLLVALAALAVLAIYKYQSTPKGYSLQDALNQRNTALRDLQVQKELNTNDQKAAANQLSDAKGQVTTLTTQKTTLCAQINAARLVQPLCK